MSKIILACFRGPSTKINSQDIAKRLSGLSNRLIPDNIIPNPPQALIGKGAFVGIINPTGSQCSHNTSAFVGNLIVPGQDWWKPGAKVPDGSFALFRSDDRYVELVTDTCASRTIWYISTEDMFVASTSQRAIVCFLQSFEPNSDVFPWMLSSGCLGYGLSWDRRIKYLAGNSKLILDRATWNLTEKRDRIEFIVDDVSDKEHERNLRETLKENFEYLQQDYVNWDLLLSGGYDSRCILLMLANRKDLKCVTWGVGSALSDKRSDASITKKLADHYGLEHRYLKTDRGDVSIEQVFKRLLIAGEGRTDTISAYMDGLDIWKQLFESSLEGVIRGDIGFSPHMVHTSEEVARAVGINMLEEYSNLAWMERGILPEQVIPEIFQRGDAESLSTWRDRLTFEYRCPVFWAALNEVKASYVEVMNPFLTRKFIGGTCRLPDHLRDRKSLFKNIVTSMSPNIGFAKKPAIGSKTRILKLPEVVEHIVVELNQPFARNILSDKLIDYILGNIKVSKLGYNERRNSMPPFLKELLPVRIWKAAVKARSPHTIDTNLLAFRAYLICRMQKMLLEDSES